MSSSKRTAKQALAMENLGNSEAFGELHCDTALEQLVLGFMLDNERYTEIEGIVKPCMFSSESLRIIASACNHLFEIGKSVDPLAVKAQLREQGDLKDGLTENVLLYHIIESAQAAVGYDEPIEHANKLRELWTVRESRRRAGEWLDRYHTPGVSVATLLNEFQGMASLETLETPDVYTPWHMIDLEKSPEVGYTTGFSKLNNCISTAGYPQGQLSVVEAYHKGGKSTFMLSSFSEQIEARLDPVYMTFADLNAARIKRRLMRMRTGWGDMPTVSFDLQEKWLQEEEHLSELDPRIFDCTRAEHLRTVEGALRYLRGQSRKREIKVAFLDYFQRITTSDPKARTDYDKNKIVADKLANFAEETGIALVVGSQVTPGGKDRETIAKGGRDIEENAGWVLRLKREADSDTIEVEIAFSRFGAQATKPLQMRFDKDHLRICQ